MGINYISWVQAALLAAALLIVCSNVASAKDAADSISGKSCATWSVKECAIDVRDQLVVERPKIIATLEFLRTSIVAQIAATSILLGWLFSLVRPDNQNNKILRVLNLYQLLREKNPIPKYTKLNVNWKVEEGAAWLIFLVILSIFYQVVQAPLSMGSSQPVNLLGEPLHVAFWANFFFQSIFTLLIMAAFFSTQAELVSRANRTVSAKLKVENPDLSWLQRRRVISEEARKRKVWFQEKLNDIGLTRRELLFVPVAQFVVNYGPVAGIEALKLL